MFYSYELLIKKDAEFALIWRIACEPLECKDLTRADVWHASIPNICSSLLKLVPQKDTPLRDFKKKFSLYLHGQLLYGVSLLLEKKFYFLQNDAASLCTAVKNFQLDIAPGNELPIYEGKTHGRKAKVRGRQEDLADNEGNLTKRPRGRDDIEKFEVPEISDAILQQAKTVDCLSKITLQEHDERPFQKETLFDSFNSELPNFDQMSDRWSTDKESQAKEDTDISLLAPLTLTSSNINEQVLSILNAPDTTLPPMDENVFADNFVTENITMNEVLPEVDMRTLVEDVSIVPEIITPVDNPPPDHLTEMTLIETFPDILQNNTIVPVAPSSPLNFNSSTFELEPLNIQSKLEIQSNRKRKITLEERIGKPRSKCIVDEVTQLSYEEMKSNISDYSDILMPVGSFKLKKRNDKLEDLPIASRYFPKDLQHLLHPCSRPVYGGTHDLSIVEDDFILDALPLELQNQFTEEGYRSPGYCCLNTTPNPSPGKAEIFEIENEQKDAGYTMIIHDEEENYLTMDEEELMDTVADIEAARRRQTMSSQGARRSTFEHEFDPQLSYAPEPDDKVNQRFGRTTLTILGRTILEREEQYDAIERAVEDASHSGTNVRFSELFPAEHTSRITAARGFSSLLDLIAQQKVHVRQDEAYSELYLSRS